MSTNHLSNLAEAKVHLEFSRLNCYISIPRSGSLPYDMIADIGGKLFKIQIKSTASEDGKMRIKVQRTRVRANGTKVYSNYSKDDFDWLAVHDRTTDKCFLFGPEHFAGTSNLIVWYNNERGSRRAKDFELPVVVSGINKVE